MARGKKILHVLCKQGGFLDSAFRTRNFFHVPATNLMFETSQLNPINAQRMLATQACELDQSSSCPSTSKQPHLLVDDAGACTEKGTLGGTYGGSISGMFHERSLGLQIDLSASNNHAKPFADVLSAAEAARAIPSKINWSLPVAAQGSFRKFDRGLVSTGKDQAVSCSQSTVKSEAKADSRKPVVDSPPTASSSQQEHQNTTTGASQTGSESDQGPQPSPDASEGEIDSRFLRSESEEAEESTATEKSEGGGEEPKPRVRTRPEPGLIEYLQDLLSRIQVAFSMRILTTAIETGFDLEDFKRGAELAFETFFEHYMKGDFDALKKMVSPSVLKVLQESSREFERRGGVVERTLEYVRAGHVTNIKWFTRAPPSSRGIPLTDGYDPSRWMSMSIRLDCSELYKKRGPDGNVIKSYIDKRGHTLRLARQLPQKLPTDELESPWYIVKV